MRSESAKLGGQPTVRKSSLIAQEAVCQNIEIPAACQTLTAAYYTMGQLFLVRAPAEGGLEPGKACVQHAERVFFVILGEDMLL